MNKRVFTADDFAGLNEANQKKVIEWLERYNLTDISMIICTSSAIPVQGSEILEHERVAGYSVIPVKRFNYASYPEDFEYVVNSDEYGFGTLTKVVEFNFNDFPWEVMEES